VPNLTPQEAAEKWARRLGNAVQDIRAGVERVSESPGQAAARKAAKWQAGVTQAMQSGKWERRVGAVTLEQWKRKTLDVGAQRIAQGATANQDKMADFAQAFFPHLAAGQARVRAMPDTTLEDRMTRAVEMMRHNANFRR
jgi:cytosine/adenosine deaminase-related metal-dependent hydrolase